MPSHFGEENGKGGDNRAKQEDSASEWTDTRTATRIGDARRLVQLKVVLEVVERSLVPHDENCYRRDVAQRDHDPPRWAQLLSSDERGDQDSKGDGDPDLKLRVQIRVDLFRLSEALPVMVSGALEFTMYEGSVTKETRSRHTPFRNWRIAGKELRPFASRDMFGWGYVVPLAWKDRAPTTSAVTLVVRYTSPAGDVVDATPVTIRTGLP